MGLGRFLAVEHVDGKFDCLGRERWWVRAEDAFGARGLRASDSCAVERRGNDWNCRSSGVLQGLHRAGSIGLREDPVHLGMGGKKARNAGLLRAERVVSVE